MPGAGFNRRISLNACPYGVRDALGVGSVVHKRAYRVCDGLDQREVGIRRTAVRDNAEGICQSTVLVYKGKVCVDMCTKHSPRGDKQPRGRALSFYLHVDGVI